LLGYRYQPGGELNPLITYVQTILDQPALNYTKEFEDYALARAEAIIYDREDFSREERTELNRVVDRIGIWNKVIDYGIYEDVFKTYTTVTKLSDTRLAGLMPEGLNWFERTFGIPYAVIKMHKIARSQYTSTEQLLARLLAYTASLFGYLIGLPYRYCFRNTPLDPSSTFYFPPAKVQIMSGGCGMSTAVQPMSEDPSSYFSDVDVYLKTLEYSYGYGNAVWGKFFQLLSTYNPAYLMPDIVFDIKIREFLIVGALALTLLPICFYKQMTNISIIVLAETSTVLVVAVFILNSIVQYSPVGLVVALTLVLYFICEFCLLLGVVLVVK
jgi:hypothetical protein